MSRNKKVYTDVELEAAYQEGYCRGYNSLVRWSFIGRTPSKKYKTPEDACSRGVYDGDKLRRRHERRFKKILAYPRRMVADSETLQILKNEATRVPANFIPESDNERAIKVTELLVRAGGL